MLSPDRKRTNDQLNTLISANAAAMAWAKAVQGTVLPIATGGNIEWYLELEQKLKPARDDSAVWLDTGGPQLYADCLQSYIAFNNLFAATSPRLRELLSQARSESRPPTASEQELMGALLQALLDEARAQHANVRAHRDRLLNFRQAMGDHSTALASSLRAINATSKADDEDIAKVQAKIAAIRERFSALMVEEAHAKDEGIKGMGSLFWMMTFGLVIAGGVLSFSGVLTVAAFSYAIFKIDKYAKEVNAAVHEINQLLTNLAPTTIRKLALIEMADTLNSLNRQNEQAAIGIDAVDVIWAHLAEKLSIFTEIVKQPITDVDGYSDLVSLEFAEKNWSAIAGHSAQLQTYEFKIHQDRAA